MKPSRSQQEPAKAVLEEQTPSARPLLEDLVTRFSSDGVTVQAATDDILVRHPPNDDATAWATFYARIKAINEVVEVSMEACGPLINTDKGHLLVPSNAPPPPPRTCSPLPTWCTVLSF